MVTRIGRIGHITIRRRRIGRIKNLKTVGVLSGCESKDKSQVSK